MGKIIKRAISWLLILAMAFSQPLVSLAESLPEVTPIDGQWLDDVPEDGNYVYMGTPSAQITEGNGVFSVPIYRTGDLDKKVSVTIHAISITAQYGKDYTLLGNNKQIGLTDYNIMQLIAGVGNDDDEEKDNDLKIRQYQAEYDVATKTNAERQETNEIGNIELVGTKSVDDETAQNSIRIGQELAQNTGDSDDSEDEENDSEEEDEENTAELLSSGSIDDENVDEDYEKSPLAILKEKQTGRPTRETEETDTSNAESITEQILGAVTPDYIKELPFACEQVISFEEGEEAAELKFRTYDNARADGNREFCLYLVSAKNATPYQVTNTSIYLQDDEEQALATLSFDADSYEAENNKVSITVKRDGIKSSMATAELKAYDVGTENETVLGEIAFLPYETEKEVKLKLDHDVTLELDNLKAADPGENMAAYVTGAVRNTKGDGLGILSVDDGSDEDDIMLLSENGEDDIALMAEGGSDSSGDTSKDELSFSINIGGKNYEVIYNKADTANKKAPVVGTIYDNGYTPALEVGKYYFSTSTEYGGMYDYTLGGHWSGDKPFGAGTLSNKYVAQNSSDGSWNNSYGYMQYYNTTMWYTGSVWCNIPSGKSIIEPQLYQYIIPDICSERAMWGGQLTFFALKTAEQKEIATKQHNGQFDRCMDTSMAIRIKTGNEGGDLSGYDYIYPYAKARDGDWHTPLSYVKYYGFAAMYKYYNVKVHNPVEKSFQALDSTVDAIPVQIEVKSGADILYDKGDKNVYVNENENSSNIVFNLKSNTVNGKDDIFCKLTGYTLTIGKKQEGKEPVTVKYPEDFVSFIKSKSKSTGTISYSDEAKTKEINKIMADLNTVPLDKYFVDWIDNVQKEKKVPVISSEGSVGAAYHQELNFTPTIEYIDVKVKVTAPKMEGSGTVSGAAEFKNSKLKEGAEVTFHAGDMIDLTVNTKTAGYIAEGYEVSTDGGVTFDIVKSSKSLVLLTGKEKGYIIRPCIQSNKNRIEIMYESGSSKKVHVENLIPQDALKNYPDLKGKYFLDLNPKEKNIYDRMRPEPGKVYSVDVVVDDETASKSTLVTRSTVRDKLTNTQFNTNKYYFTARKAETDNIFYVGTEETEKSKIVDYTLNGRVVMKSDTIRHDGLGLRSVPIVGYSVFAAGPQKVSKDSKTGKETKYVSVAFNTIAESANMTLSGIKAASGDRITLALDNGINDGQVTEIKLGSPTDGTYNIGQIDLSYPMEAPSFITMSYGYDNKEHTKNIDLKDNTIKCYKDTLNLTAEVNANGRSIACVKIIVQSVDGQRVTYTAEPKVNEDKSISNTVFTLAIPDMNTKLRNGDHIYAYIVDKEKKHVNGVGDLDIVYPTVDTGYVMYVENELVKPKYFDVSADSKNSVDLPMIGKPAANVKSGVLTYTKTKYPNNQGYSVSVNGDFVLGFTPRSASEKKSKFENYTNQTKRIAKEREYAAVQGNEEQVREGRQRIANQIQEMGGDAFDAAHEGMAHGTEQANQRQAELTEKIITADVFFVLDFEFVYDSKRNDYFLAMWGVTVGGNASISKTFYGLVVYVPVYFNLYGAAQIALTFAWTNEETKERISEGDFNNTDGNLKNLVNADGVMYSIETVFIGKMSAGVGVNDALGVRVYGKIQFDVDFINTNNTLSDDKNGSWGLIIAGSIGAEADLIVTTLSAEIIKVQVGFGRYENQTAVEGLWDPPKTSKASANSLKSSSEERPVYSDDSEAAADASPTPVYVAGDDGNATLADDAALDDGFFADDDIWQVDDSEEDLADDGEYKVQWSGAGTNDFSSFGKYSEEAYSEAADILLLSAPAKLKERYVLQKDAAEHTRAGIIQIKDDGTQLVLFLGASGKNPKETCLYYSVGRGSEWSGPFAIDDDGTFDTTPDMLKVSDNKLFITWANARDSVTGSSGDSFRDKYTKFNICGAMLDLSSTLGEDGYKKKLYTLHDESDDQDKFFNLSPQLTILRDTVYCTYLKRDLSKAESDKDLTDLKKLYSTMAYVTFNTKTEAITAEKLIPISDVYREDKSKIVDPLVTDYSTETFTLKELAKKGSASSAADSVDKDIEYIAAIYTVDTDEDMSTAEDRNIYLDVYDVTNKKNYYPVMIGSSAEYYTDKTDTTKKTSNTASQASPKLYKIDGNIYATWVEGNEKFVLLDISDKLQTLLYSKGISDFYTGGTSGGTSTGTATAAATGTNAGALAATAASVSKGTSTSAPTGTASNASNKTAANSLVGISESSALKVLKASLLGSSLALDLNLTGDAQAWSYNAETGWYSNGPEWYMTDYSDLSSRLKSYYTNLYTEQDANADERYSADEINENVNEEFTKLRYNETVFGSISEHDVGRFSVDISETAEAYNISEYKLVSDGTDLYVFFVGMCSDPRHTGTEIFGMKFSSGGKNGETELEGGFTQPVMLTADDDDSDEIIDEFDIYTDSAKKAYAVANTFKVKTNEDGSTESGAKTENTLSYFCFEPSGSVKVKENSIKFNSSIEQGKITEIWVDAVNQGLYDASGFQLSAYLVDPDGKESLIFSELTPDISLKPGESYPVRILWQVPREELTGYSIRVKTKEKGYDEVFQADAEIPVKAELEFYDEEITYDGTRVNVSAKVHNYGNADCKDVTFRLYRSNYGNETEIQMIAKSGGMKSGEDYTVEFSFIPKASDFDDVGHIDLVAKALSAGKEMAYTYHSFVPNGPVLCEIEGGLEKLSLKTGEEKKLNIETVPWSKLTEKPQFYSTDPEIAYVDSDGVVHALKSGRCIIVVYYLQLGISGSIDIEVKAESRHDSKRDSKSGEIEISKNSDMALSGYSGVTGDWKLNAGGRWTFTAGGRGYASEWGYIFNPYATENQEKYDWFRFDKDGYMLTGWYKDEDGNWYYLWPLSDNLLGHMVTGWQLISGKWYFFNTKSDGTLGAMYADKKTPDGYYVGKDGAWVE